MLRSNNKIMDLKTPLNIISAEYNGLGVISTKPLDAIQSK